MRVTRDLAEIVRELRDANEAWEHPALLGDSDAQRVAVGQRLSDAVSELKGWLDTRGPKALQSPHQGPEGWGWVDGATRFVQLEVPRRVRLRRFASSARLILRDVKSNNYPATGTRAR